MIAIMALVIRIVAGVAVGWNRLLPAADQPLYDAFAKNILAGKGFQVPDIYEQGQKKGVIQEDVKKLGYFGVVMPNRPTAFFPPLYPLMMAAAYGILGAHPGSVRLFQSFLDALACFLIGWMGVRMFGSRQGILAAMIYAIYPAFIALTLVLWTISLGVFTLVLAMAMTVNFQKNPTGWSALWMGMAWGLATLSRSAMLPFLLVILLLAWLDIRRFRRGDFSETEEKSKLIPHSQWTYPLIMVAGMMILMIPWGVRNSVVMGHFTISPTKGGRNLYEANNGIFSKPYLNYSASGDGMERIYHRFAESHLNDLRRKELIEFPQFPEDMGEFQRDRILTRQVTDFLLANPKVALELCFLRFYSLIRITPGFLPHLMGKLIGMVSMGGVLIFGFLGLIIRAKQWIRYSYFYLLILYYVAIHTVTAAGIPHRLPLDAILILFAGTAVEWFYDRISGHTPPHRLKANYRP